ncbi:MAG: ribosome assembly cofactor RimP [Bacteroidetes bacterium]|nr:ribosome assembly cofactor RimP [Bacteroidota bacterium]MBT3750083.1 ribosome assembly cofactor RimP [Bacteroidota bacterium]MBT4402180.1 ribosome assembly cofactor RimP [Bacteroidota bacterium]MBT4411665.1 ribosome assembly cofactor RimP [Bacteroidota bacterium]MBT5424620.1 ribosome assembly cofactor RimP [Bacteroidota bacterium]
MIDSKKIEEIISEQVTGSDIFIVDIQVKPGNLIQVFLDHPEGITIEACVEYSRLIESNLDREKEDFELRVSSPGLNQSFKVIEQYYKNIGRSIKVVTIEGDKLRGVLTTVNKTGVEMDTEHKVNNPEGKKKKIEIQSRQLDYTDIKSAIVNIEF